MRPFLLLFIILNNLIAGNSFVCQPNAIANRDYSFNIKQWGDGITLDKSNDNFGTLPKESIKKIGIKTIVFKNLYTDKPLIDRIISYEDGTTYKSSFEGEVITLVGDFFLIKWSIVADNTWIASINTKYKKATITNYYNGNLSFGTIVTSLDCE